VIGAAIMNGRTGNGISVFGYAYFEVLSMSMQSEIPKGSLVVTKKIPSKEIKEGDVITFLRKDEEKITHKVIEVVPDFDGQGTLGFRTKGTDNPDPDPDLVAATNVIGVVQWHMEELGYFLSYIADNIKYLFVAFVLIILTSIAIRVLLGSGGKSQLGKPGGRQAEKRGREERRMAGKRVFMN
jgi:signal peptidase